MVARPFILRFIPYLLIISLLGACSSSEIMPSAVESGRDFYPVQTGNTWIYQVDTIRYSSRFVTSLNTIVVDTVKGRYFLKEIIADSIGLQEGNPLFRIELFRSADSTGPWAIDSVWSIQRGKDKILKTENNRPLVKLKFPVSEGSRWDGNQYNSLQDSSGTFWYKATAVNKAFAFQNNFYPGVVVVQKSDSNCLGKSDFQETYLKDIGPVSVLKSSLIYSQDGPDPCGSIPRIESGRVRNFKLIRFEKNP
jgi:hypothetical protein